MKINSTIRTILYFILTAIILCIPALYNRYVLFYSDTAIYLDHAINLVPTYDRPIGYGYFIRATTWQSTMWLAIFFQGLIASLLIYHTLKTTLTKISFKKIYHFFTICVLMFFSTLGWYVSLLMPDVFTSFLILAMFNVIFGKNNIISYILYSALIFFIVFSHLSNMHILALILFVIWLFILFKKKFAEYRRKALLGSLIVIFVSVGTLIYLIKFNYDHFHKAVLSPTSGVFFFARLIDTGIVDNYLKENCDKKNYQICNYKDNLSANSQLFIWDWNSAFYKMGGWKDYQEEPKAIVKDILLSPKYYGVLFWDFSISSLKQLFEFKIGGDLANFCSGPWLPVYESSYKHFHRNEIKQEFFNSKQSKEDLKFDTLNDIIYLVVFMSVMIIAFVLSRYKVDNMVYFLLVTGFSGVFFNAAVCANLSNILNRYQARVIWIIPFIAIILFLNYILPKIISFLRK